MQIHTMHHMRTQDKAFNMVPVTTVKSPWDMAVPSAIRRDRTLVLHQESLFPEEAQRLVSLFGQYLRELMFCGTTGTVFLPV